MLVWTVTVEGSSLREGTVESSFTFLEDFLLYLFLYSDCTAKVQSAADLKVTKIQVVRCSSQSWCQKTAHLLLLLLKHEPVGRLYTHL